jgi:hypothetical protein
MTRRFNHLLDFLSEFLAHRKGLLPMIGLILVAANAVVQFWPGTGWLVQTDLMLHLGVILAILGILLAWAL